MEPRIEKINEKKIMGMRLNMSLDKNMTGILWKQFMMNRKSIKNMIDSCFYSIQVYDNKYSFDDIDFAKEFTKWAAVEVDSHKNLPEEMEAFTLPEGQYAVFSHKGSAATAPATFQHIFGKWLPESDYKLDDRPHFEKLGAKYSNNSEDSEEEIWIPVISKN